MSAAKDQVFLFADLAGFTALTDIHGDHEAAEVAANYTSKLRAMAEEHGGDVIKTIGDAVLVRVPDATRALVLAVSSADEVGSQHGFPAVRVGLDYGSAVEREGDYFGATVNTAARVTALAGAGEVLLTEAAKEAAGEVDGVRITLRERCDLRGISSPVTIYSAASEGAGESKALPTDPVCHMAVDPEHCVGQLTYGGETYYFCSLPCAQRFAEDPASFVDEVKAPAGSGKTSQSKQGGGSRI